MALMRRPVPFARTSRSSAIPSAASSSEANDWRRGVVQVEPAEQRGKTRWFTEGRGLCFEICQGMRQVLSGEELEIAAPGLFGGSFSPVEVWDFSTAGELTVERRVSPSTEASRWHTCVRIRHPVRRAICLPGVDREC